MQHERRTSMAVKVATGAVAVTMLGGLLPAPALAAGSSVAPPTAVTAAGTAQFSDVAGNAYEDEIRWLAEQGITTGWDDGTYRPLQSVNRDAMAAFLYRLKGSPDYTAPARSRFKDVAPGDRFYAEIHWLAEQGITTGWDDGTYRPLLPINRDAMAAFVYRYAGSPAHTGPAASPFSDVRPGDRFYAEIHWLAEQEITTGWNDDTFRPQQPIARDAMAAFLHRYAHPAQTPPPQDGDTGAGPADEPADAPGDEPTDGSSTPAESAPPQDTDPGETPGPVDVTAPGAPAGLTATGTAAGVALDWDDRSEQDLAGYHVYRSASADGEYTRLTGVPLTASAHDDATAPAGAATHYRVTAVDTAGNESAPSGVEGTRPVEESPVAGADLTVAQDGSGDHTTIAAALAAAPADAAAPFVIAVRPGTYRETLVVDKPNVTLTGAGTDAADTVISYDNAAGTRRPDGTAYGTTGSATVTIKADGVTTRNLTIENSYVETGSGSEQAVALKTTGDRLVFDTVRLLGDQDTLYADSPRAGATARSYYVDSYIEGDVDFVFGRGTAVFDRSTLKAATRGSASNNGYITAASTDRSLPYGYLITDSTVVSDAPANTFHLGRPWQPSGDANAVAQVVIRDTELPAAIKSAPWTDMSTTFSWRDARLFEYRNTGAGAAVNADRPQLSDFEARKYTKWAYLAGSDGWNPTGEAPPADTTAPGVPAGLAAEAGDSNVALSWTASADTDLAGYNLYRSTGGDVALTEANRVNDVLLTGTVHTDRTAANGTTYTYVLTAVDRAGNESAASAPVTGAPVGVPLPAHDVLVAADGTGQFTGVQEALAAAPAGTAAKPTVIAVKPGVYKELVTVGRNHVQLIGTTGDAKDVVLTYDNAAGTPVPGGTGTYGTGKSQSVLVSGSSVTVKDLTVENSFDEAAHTYSGEQAVALKTTGDRLVFDNVRVLGNQDTLLVDSPDAPVIARSYFVDCYVEGDVDFVFGRGTAVFRNSRIHALSRGSASNNGYITAASTSDHNPHGFLIVDSTITSDAPAGTISLGRPWRGWTDGYTKNGVVYNSRGQVTVRNTELPAAIRTAQPWADMSPNLWTDGRFAEYANTGAGATVNADRPQLTDAQAADATPDKYLAGTDGWNPLG